MTFRHDFFSFDTYLDSVDLELSLLATVVDDIHTIQYSKLESN